VKHQQTLLVIAPLANARATNLWAVVTFVPGVINAAAQIIIAPVT
jgi:hypothetical protein